MYLHVLQQQYKPERSALLAPSIAIAANLPTHVLTAATLLILTVAFVSTAAQLEPTQSTLNA